MGLEPNRLAGNSRFAAKMGPFSAGLGAVGQPRRSRARGVLSALFCAGMCRGELYSRAFSWRTASADPLGGQKQLGADQGRVLAVHKAKKNIVLRARRALASSPFVGRVS